MENEKTVSKFLVKNPTYRIVGGHVLQPIFLKKCITPENYVRFHPNEVPFSSYFAAVLQKGS